MKQTRVYLTVDIEGAEERRRSDGSVQPPLDYELRVWGRFVNQPRELGIGFIMNLVERFGFKATFFTEALGASYFGEDRLAEICSTILGRGHDVQLHCHPVQRQVDWFSRGYPQVSDQMHDYSMDEQSRMMAQGLATLVRCGVSRDAVKAFRAGGFAANNQTWRAMAGQDLTLSSSYDLMFMHRDPLRGCRIAWPREEAALFASAVPGVFELPITCFRDGGGYRHLQIQAVSANEMRNVLLQAHEAGLSEVCILTHSFEYSIIESVEERRGRPDILNQRRLHDLCAFLALHRDRFSVETVGALARRLPHVEPSIGLPIPVGSGLLRIARMVEQAGKRLRPQGPIGAAR